MAEGFEDQYMDVLQNIEFGIMQVYREHPDLTDHNVDKALNGLIRVYQAQLREQSAPKLALRELEQQVYDAVKHMCDWRMGKSGSQDDDGEDSDALPEDIEPKTSDEIIACLKRIRKSINLWTKQGGRQGYLYYIASFLGE